MGKGPFLGNLLWSDVHKVLRDEPGMPQGEANVIRRMLVELMEDLNMTEPIPLTYGDSELYYRWQAVLERMREAINAIVDRLAVAFVVSPKKQSLGQWFAYREIEVKQFVLAPSLHISHPGSDRGAIWPCLYVRTEGLAFAKIVQEVLELRSEPVEGWDGTALWPAETDTARIMGSWDWNSQLHLLTELYEGWFSKLAERGLVQRK
jgi:hypothetical protein